MIKSEKNKKQSSVLRKILIAVLWVLLILFIAVGAELLYSNLYISVDTHTIESDSISTPLRLGLISDLHSVELQGKSNSIYKKLRAQNPDIILLAGDAVSKDDTADEDMEYLSDTISTLGEIAPVYYCIGNHERFNPRLDDILTAVSGAGGKCLDNEYMHITVNDNDLCIGGISYYRRWDEDANAFLKDFVSDAGSEFTLLMCHHPEFYEWGIEDYPIDLMVSGHTHGGMIQLPFYGAIYAPEQGWKPKHAGGLYETNSGHLAVTTGIGSSPSFLPRMFNPPQIMIIDVI